MRKIIMACIFLLSAYSSQSQNVTINVNTNVGLADSTFVVQTMTTDSFHMGNHPGAGPYQNAEILICSGAQLIYNYGIGTSSGPTFYLENNATLKVTNQLMDARIYMKPGATFNANNHNNFVFVKRHSTANIINSPVGASVIDSIFNTVTYTFNGWTGNVSPCNVANGVSYETDGTMDLVLYPNPCTNFLNLAGGAQGEKKCFVFTHVGQLILCRTVNASEQVLDVSALKTGNYHLQIFSNNKVYNHRLMIEK